MATKRSSNPQFLNPGPEISDPKRARVVVLPVPLEKTTSYMKGTAKGPEAIVEASAQVEFFDAELKTEPCSVGIHTDWELAEPKIYEEPIEAILDRYRKKATQLIEMKRFMLALGGEHTVSIGLIDPYIKRYGEDLTVVQIDAHADLKPEYEGTPYSHACAMRGLLGRVPLVAAGIRSVDSEEFELGQKAGVRTFYAHETRKNPGWIADLVKAIETPKVYLTVDVDGIDPSVIGTTGTPEPGGLGWYETLDLIRSVAEKCEIVGADVNEFAEGVLPYSAYAAAKLCYKIIGYSLFTKR